MMHGNTKRARFRAAAAAMLFAFGGGVGRAELVIKPTPPKFRPNPAACCGTVEATFLIETTEDEKKVRDEAIANGTDLQEFTVTFLPKGAADATVSSVDGIATRVELKPEKGDAIVFTAADAGGRAVVAGAIRRRRRYRALARDAHWRACGMFGEGPGAPGSGANVSDGVTGRVAPR